jgi:phosphotransferase system HPr (HPr) family protein
VTLDLLPPSGVVVGASAHDRDAAIALVGSMLVADGRATADYVAEMREREQIISTYLGNGIALPHGTNEARTAVLRTGLAVAQFPVGVAWGDDRAHLVIGLAATSEEHIGILSRLATILDDEALCRRLGTTADAEEIRRVLLAPTDEPAAAAGSTSRDDEISVSVTITNPSGLHARPAASVVERLRAYAADVRIEADGRRASARSITGLLGLGAATSDTVRVTASGADAQAAIDAVTEILTATGG